MELLKDFLLAKGYSKTKLKFTKTNHFEVRVRINGKKGRFILDTGASNSCVGNDAIDLFSLNVEDSEIKAVGAGASNMDTKMSKANSFKIGKWRADKLPLVIFNLDHVKNGLISHGADPVDGIIGADILKYANAIIDYEKKYLYLKL